MAITLCLMVIIFQIKDAMGKHAVWFRLALGFVAFPYLMKTAERVISHDIPTWIDASRDVGTLFLYVVIILTHWGRFKLV